MTRYFVETNVLLALTFHHDRWHREVQPLYKHNRLYTSEFVIYEYCNRDKDNGDPLYVPDTADLKTDVTATKGKYGKLLDDLQENIENNLPLYHRQIDILQTEGLTIEKVIDTFMEHFEFRNQAEPYIQSFFQEYFATREVTTRTAKKAANKLNEDLRKRAQETKKELMEEVYIIESVYDKMNDEREKLDEFVGIVGYDEYGLTKYDAQWLLDAIHLCQEGVLSALVTGDKDDVVQFQDEIQSLFDISVLYTKEDVYTDDLNEVEATD